jgi:hypothetical protein
MKEFEMRHYGNAKQGDIIRTRGSGNAEGAGGVISTVIITDPKANGKMSDMGGYECRDATPTEISNAKKIETRYC